MSDPLDLAGLRARLAAVAGLDAAALDAEEIGVLGRKQGALTARLKALPSLAVEQRREAGASLNALKLEFEAAFAERRTALAGASRAAARDAVDPTMPPRRDWVGSRHPVTEVTAEIVEIFRGLGFSVALGPEVEDEELNFLALNFPPDHPAMDMHDTLYLDPEGSAPGAGGRLLLRTHTSPVQIRVMREGPPPYRVVIPGTVYRNDAFDPSHAPAFAQIEGLAIDRGITFVDLKATLTHFAERFLGPDTRVRFRPSFFPFTEPSAEMDVGCLLCGGSGCGACKGTGWMEILGCGMVHEQVLRNVDLDPEEWTGWAFGMGPQRIAMLRYGLPDIRLLYGGDMRFLSQFGGLAG
ncbi:MAG TPA: phenylalanine--tRNA ligase subunit alpha [Gemmatimonadales bacterium]|nr:phenylalanine--tRNA ligase subunit alpha [Gemmatimonadales bacterium]